MNENEMTEDLTKRFELAWEQGMEQQRGLLKLLLEFERFICIEEDTKIPPDNIYIRVSSNIAKQLKEMTAEAK